MSNLVDEQKEALDHARLMGATMQPTPIDSLRCDSSLEQLALNREVPKGGAPDSEHRSQQRESLQIPVKFHRQDTIISGYLINLSSNGLGMICESILSAGTPLDLRFAFGSVCHLNISGQVVYCWPLKDETFSIGIKLCAIRDFENKILSSAIEELKQSFAIQEKSSLTILVATDSAALEAAELSSVSDIPDEKSSALFVPISRGLTRLFTTRRVVITGIGAVAPNGIGRKAFWKGLAEGKNCVDRISFFDPSGHPSQVAAEIRDFDPRAFMPAKEVNRMARSAQLVIAAAQLAILDGELELTDPIQDSMASIMGTGAAGLEYVEEDFYWVRAGGVGRMRPFAGIAAYGGALSSEVSRSLGLNGPSLTISTGCTGAVDAMGHTLNMIRYGFMDIGLTGGADAPVSPGILGAFCQMGAAATRFNEEPKKASRPFNKDRDGFVIGEGAWVFIFEELKHALRRGATIYGEVIGYAATCDAYRMAQPLPTGDFTAKAIRDALSDAMVRPDDVDYVNAYGNATPINDRYETMVLKRVFGEHAHKLLISSTKSMIGHAIGACGAGGVAATLLAIKEGIVHPTINYEVPDPECDLDYVPNIARKAEVHVALCNTLGFGSKNAAIVLRKFDDSRPGNVR